ncbi:elongation factor G-like protein EF-G2 [Speluncibacter jeojiensis]|uniref:Elongation factor G-like protein EF-G2 n=1 Tax=Speluncibacter jeojiensis TaxID=2710754 RepID=A0A9X4LVK7_9ACTN|nr:elongation factor G-like protein EF-G2 [Corynebacteriales bacterium D3-21]
MSDRTSARAGQAPPVSGPDRLRNVVLIGCSGVGKTTLAESLALAAGMIGRAGQVTEGTTVSDFEPIETKQQHSVHLAVLPLPWNGAKINLLDTPGHPDFAAELRAGLHVADAAVFVVSATDPVTEPTRLLWHECAEAGIPRAIAVAKLDVARAGFEDILTACHDAFGLGPDTLRPVYAPVLRDGVPCGSVDLLTGRTYGEATESDAAAPSVAAARESLIEAVSGQDDTLLERFLSGEPIDAAMLEEGIRREVHDCALHPALAVTDAGLGAAELLDLVVTSFPDPTHRRGPASGDPDSPLAAQVVRIASDPYVGRISLVRVFAGTLRPDMHVHVSGPGRSTATTDTESDERITTLTSPFGKQQRPVREALAGDLVCVPRLSGARIGDTLGDGEHDALESWPVPEPLLPVPIEPHSKADDDKLTQALARLCAEDPAVRLEQNPDTHQLVLWCTGEAHADAVLDQLRSRYAVHVDTVPYQVALQETFGSASSGHGRLVKQSGGHGQYAICDLQVEPLPTGSGVEFCEHVVGGAVPRHFIPSVEKGVRAQLSKGVATGHPLVDVRITLVDGKAHSVDSSDAAFQTAAAMALKDAAEHASIRLLEPVAAVSVLVPDEYQGAVLSDLSGRRGRVLGSELGDEGMTRLRAEVPEIELARYPIELRALSRGTAEFARTHLRHELVPAAVADRVSGNGRPG